MKIVVAVILLLTSAFGQTTKRADQPTRPVLKDVNPDVLRIVIEDQWDRGNDLFGSRQIAAPDAKGESVSTRDERRQSEMRKLIEQGKLKSGRDFFFAALVFQHSTKPAEVLLAHELAVTAVSKGNSNGKYMAAASLDRYLWNLNQPQVYGTQFKKVENGNWSMEPYARESLTDAERRLWCVIPLAQQEEILRGVLNGDELKSTSISDCK
jgi:hypothetical protein